jgi:hypothetical protein
MRRAKDRRDEIASNPFHPPLEHTARDALLPPAIARAHFPILEQTSQLGAGAGSARGPIISTPRAKHEVPAVALRVCGGAEELDVIDFLTGLAGDTREGQSLADLPSERDQPFHVVQAQFLTMILD